jgi:5'-deoxynucleotidase YfbR-like HD superfamily hydrolase
MNQKKIRALRHIRRFNYHSCNQYESVAEHSFFVALLAYEIALNINLSDVRFAMDCMHAALMHDTEEAVLGDIPYLVRRRFMSREASAIALAELGVGYNWSSTVEAVVEFADAYELKMYLEDERQSGNNQLYQIECETMGRLHRSPIAEGIKHEWIGRLLMVPTSSLPEDLLHE